MAMAQAQHRAIMTLALRSARRAVERQLRATGRRLPDVEHKEIMMLAHDYLVVPCRFGAYLDNSFCLLVERNHLLAYKVGRDKGRERALEIQSTDCGDKTRARIPASSGLFALNREISVCVRLRGGAGRTRTSNQTIISRQL
jgi:hypothetical protein